MLCLESNLLIDALDPERDGHDDARAFLDRHRDRPLFLPTVCVWEVLRGPAKRGDREACRRTAGRLEFGFQLPFDAGAAREAAAVETEQKRKGEPLNVRDYAVAGTVRQYGGRLVTRDGGLESVTDVEVVPY
jgi:predicted nucleic acid-binding protein